MALLVVACGEEKKSLTVEEQAKAYCEQMIEAIQNNDEAKFESVVKESDAWYEKLSKEDQAKVDAVSQEYEARLFEAAMAAVDEEDLGCDYYEDEEDLGCDYYEDECCE